MYLHNNILLSLIIENKEIHMSDLIKPVSFTLGEHDRHFISGMVETGRFGNRTEVVRAGLRLLEDYESTHKMQRLRVLMAEGDADIKAGKIKSFDRPEDLFDDILNSNS